MPSEVCAQCHYGLKSAVLLCREELRHLSLELASLPPVISAGVSYCVSTVFNYVASMRYVFAHREGLSRTREFIIFVTLSVIGLGLNEAIMWLGGRPVGDEWYMLTKVVATTLVMFWNFFSRKRWLDAG